MNKINSDLILDKLTNLLPNVPKEVLISFIKISKHFVFKNKDIIIKEGETTKRTIFIIKGVVRGFLLLENGKEKTIQLRGNGIIISYPESIFKNTPSKYTYQSLGKTEALIFNSEDFINLAKQHQEFMVFYTGILQEAIITLNNRVESMIVRTPEERFNDLIKLNPLFIENTYNKYLANYLGITPVSLSRIKNRSNKN